MASITDPLARTTTFRYDAADRLIRQLLPGGDTITYAYEPRGNLAALKPPGRPEHTFAYTPIELTSRYDPPDEGFADTTHYAYNGDRQLEAITRPDGAVVDIGYESATGRLSTITIPRGTVGFGYHAQKGTVSTITSPDTVTTNYTYDGPLPTSESWTGGITGSVAVTYNNDFAVTTQKVNNAAASEVTYGYDQDGLVTSANVPGTAFSIVRDATNGVIESATLGAVETWPYLNAYGELDSLTTLVNGAITYRASYVRDALGRITTLIELMPDSIRVFDYDYDVRGRLTDVRQNNVPIAHYGYDANGNRVSFVGVSAADTASATYDRQDRLLRYRDTRYEWTPAGELRLKIERRPDPNLVYGEEPFWERDTTWYTYDELGNLVGVGLPNGDSLTYVIDGQNRRVGRKLNGTLVQGWLYQNGLNPIAELDGSGNVVARYVYATKGHVPDYVVKGGVVYRLVTDHLGSVRLVVNASSGAIAERRDYDAWGEVVRDDAPGWLTLGFAGGITDDATGLARFGARDYEAGTGRWLNKYPIGFAGEQANLYAYSLSDPANYIDPSGLKVNLAGCVDRLQTLLDAVGIFDPTGLTDGANALIYLARGNGADAAISALAIVPYLGDAGKIGRLGARAGKAARETEAALDAAKLAKKLASEEGVAELLSGGGKIIAGPGTRDELRSAGRLAGQYGGRTSDWVKVTSTAPGRLQTHAYRNVTTGELVELKSVIR